MSAALDPLGALSAPRAGVPEACKSCSHRFNDDLEGQLCNKVPQKVQLPSGRVIDWHGAPVTVAFADCGGTLRRANRLGRLWFWLGL